MCFHNVLNPCTSLTPLPSAPPGLCRCHPACLGNVMAWCPEVNSKGLSSLIGYLMTSLQRLRSQQPLFTRQPSPHAMQSFNSRAAPSTWGLGLAPPLPLTPASALPTPSPELFPVSRGSESLSYMREPTGNQLVTSSFLDKWP